MYCPALVIIKDIEVVRFFIAVAVPVRFIIRQN